MHKGDSWVYGASVIDHSGYQLYRQKLCYGEAHIHLRRDDDGHSDLGTNGDSHLHPIGLPISTFLEIRMADSALLPFSDICVIHIICIYAYNMYGAI